LHLRRLLAQSAQLRRGVARVGYRDLRAAARAPARHRQAGRTQAQDEDVLVFELVHYRSFNVGKAHQAQQHGDDPEAHHHLGFLPATLFKMVVQRRHLQDAPAFTVFASWCT
jgi:hypothetical protein